MKRKRRISEVIFIKHEKSVKFNSGKFQFCPMTDNVHSSHQFLEVLKASLDFYLNIIAHMLAFKCPNIGNQSADDCVVKIAYNKLTLDTRLFVQLLIAGIRVMGGTLILGNISSISMSVSICDYINA